MYPRNAASPERIAVGAVVQISDGAVQTSGVSVSVRGQGGASGAGAGTTAFDNEILEYTPTQAETDFTSFVVVAFKTGCIPVAVTVITTASSVPGRTMPADGSITANVIANAAIDAATFAADVDAEFLSYIVDDATRIDASALNTASVTTIPAIVADTNELQTDWADGGRLDLILDARASTTHVQEVEDKVDTVDTVVDAVKVQTDKFVFTVANVVNANVTHVNEIEVTGDGQSGTEWGPA